MSPCNVEEVPFFVLNFQFAEDANPSFCSAINSGLNTEYGIGNLHDNPTALGNNFTTLETYPQAFPFQGVPHAGDNWQATPHVTSPMNVNVRNRVYTYPAGSQEHFSQRRNFDQHHLQQPQHQLHQPQQQQQQQTQLPITDVLYQKQQQQQQQYLQSNELEFDLEHNLQLTSPHHQQHPYQDSEVGNDQQIQDFCASIGSFKPPIRKGFCERIVESKIQRKMR